MKIEKCRFSVDGKVLELFNASDFEIDIKPPRDCEQCEGWDWQEKCCWAARGGLCKARSNWRPKYYVLEERYNKLRKLADFYADYANWNHTEMINREDIEQLTQENLCPNGDTELILEDEIGGAKARQLIKELDNEL